MSITDELREWAVNHRAELDMGQLYPAMIEGIADRIDAEHQKAEDEWRAKNGYMWLKGYAACHEELMEGHPVIAADLEKAGWVELPKDADGVPIRVGDMMEFSAFEIEKPVTRMVDGIGQGVFFAWCGERGYQQHEAKRYRHHHAPTVEDVLSEMLNEAFPADFAHRSEAIEAMVAEYAKRLTLAEGEDA